MKDPESIKEILDEKTEKLKNIQQNETKISTIEEPKPKQNGGARPGAGRPKGSMSEAKRTTLEAKNHFIEMVKKNVNTLFNAQIDLAKGEKCLYVKYHTGEGKDKKVHIDVVEDSQTISKYLQDEGYTLNKGDGDEYYFISTKPANNQAIDSLLNRAFGKAPEKIEIEGGFFKQETLKIEIVKPEEIETNTEDEQRDETDYSEIERQTEPGSQPS